VRFYLTQTNLAYGTGQVGTLEQFNGAECDSCANIVNDIERIRTLGHTVRGDRFKIGFVATAPALVDGSFIVDFQFSSDAYIERAASGEVVKAEPAQVAQDAQARVRQVGESWTILGFRYVDA
jgi:hypothetical protein